MSTQLLTKSFRTASAIAGFLIVKAAANGQIAVATAATDALIGTSGSMGAPAEGIADVGQAGWDEVRAGANVSFGDPLTANNASKAIKAVPVAGSVVRIIGFAMADGSDGDIIPYQIAPGVLPTPAA